MSFRMKAAFVLIAMTYALGGPAIAQTGTLFVEGDYVGVGTPSPSRPLHVITANAPANTVVQIENNGPARFRITNTATGETWNIGHHVPSGTGLVYSDVGDSVTEMRLDVNGNLTIAGQLTTAGGTYPDYVFDEDYPLRSLSDLDSFIKEHGHLPNMPAADDVAAQGGINMSELQLLLLEKVEELTLYTLAQQETIDHLQGTDGAMLLARLEAAGHQVAELEDRLQARDQQLQEVQQREADLLQRVERLEQLLPPSP